MSPLRQVTRPDAPPYFVFDALADAPLIHGVFTRHGGVSATPFDTLNVSSSIGDDPAHVNTNRERVLAALGRSRDGLVMAGLVHGTDVAYVGAATKARALDGGGRYIPGVDALITDDPTLTLLITAADCAQVFLYDPVQRAVGLAHAGWRGTVAGVLTATVAAMREQFGSYPARLQAAIGPCLGPCCARFSDPTRELPAWCAPYIDGQYVDLWAMNRDQLLGAELQARNVSLAAVCTVCRRDTFFSHRGDAGRTGRFAGAIGLR